MTTRCTGGAILALSMMMGASAARAQYLPMAPGPHPGADPLPVGPSHAPMMHTVPKAVPGPMPPWMAPKGPCPDLDLPGDLPGAFPPDDECCNEYCGFYIGGGALGYKRSGLGNSTLAVMDTRRFPLFNAPDALNLHNLAPSFEWGFKLTAGHSWGNGAVEVSGFYLTPVAATVLAPDPVLALRQATYNLASFFSSWPIGFEGNGGLWNNALAMQADFSSNLGGVEVNYRTWTPVAFGCEGLVGCRYLGLTENFSLATVDRNIESVPIQQFMASYQIKSQNTIVAPQLGFECTKDICSFLACGFGLKGAWGADFYRVRSTLVRGDGLVGVNELRQGTCFTQIYEGNAFLDLCCWANGHLRASYNFLGVVGLPTATEQINFNLATQLQPVDTKGSVFYHGPVIELYILF